MAARLTKTSRAAALACGWWQGHDGDFVRVEAMADAHLLNAFVRAHLDGDPPTITHVLAAEVIRRGLDSEALALAAERERKTA